jgi:hypothetical protein
MSLLQYKHAWAVLLCSAVLQDRVILVDTTFLPILGRIWKQLPLLEAVVVLTDR